MTNCGRREAAGRAEFLHAITNVLECLPWSDARAFQNMIMVRLEQDRVDWAEDFSILADIYIDKKVRLNMKSKGSNSGSSYFSKSSASRGSGRGFKNNFGRTNPGSYRSKSLYAVVCRQWNYGTCGYGDKCRKWHVCWSCAEAGKPGEQHRATSHDNASGGGEKGKQRI